MELWRCLSKMANNHFASYCNDKMPHPEVQQIHQHPNLNPFLKLINPARHACVRQHALWSHHWALLNGRWR